LRIAELNAKGSKARKEVRRERWKGGKGRDLLEDREWTEDRSEE
jgi:hypothetical protein